MARPVGAWGPRFNGARSRRTRRGATAATGRCGGIRFNGARSRRTRRGNQALLAGANVVLLQWGPVPEDQERALYGEHFAAQAELQWGPVPEDQERVRDGFPPGQVEVQLQWGPVPEDQERRQSPPQARPTAPASMGPGPGGPGEDGKRRTSEAGTARFNGARSRRTRTPGRVAQAGHHRASMGPGPGGPGEGY